MNAAKIAIILPSLALGGVERVMVNLANDFAQRNYEVHMVLSNAGDSVFLRQLAPEIRVYDLGASRVLKSFFPLIEYLKSERPELLLVGQNHMNILAVWAKLLAGVKSKLFLTLHSYISLSNPSDWIPLLAKLSYPLADGLIAVSNGVADDQAKFLALSRSKIQVLCNPAITPDIFEKAQASIDDAAWKSLLQEPFIVSVGRLSPEKDYATLIKCFNDVKDAIPHNLVILGEGFMRGRLEDLIDHYDLKERVLLPGYVENPYSIMSRSELFVLSSKWEGLPTVLIEAAALGIKVVATDCEGSREALQGGRLGTLVPLGDQYALAKALVEGVTGKAEAVDESALRLYWHTTASENYLQYLGSN